MSEKEKKNAKQRIMQVDPDKLEQESAAKSTSSPVHEEDIDPDEYFDLNFIPLDEEEEIYEEPKTKLKWAYIIPVLVVVFCMAFFAVASYAGWIQTFITPNSRQSKAGPVALTRESTEEETISKLTTEEETTEEYIPSYYVIYVNLAYNVVTVYTRGEKLNDGYDIKDPKDDEYDLIPEIAFTCSPGVGGKTPTGQFFLQERNDWCFMEGDVYTQYATRIEGPVMFHSIPYYSKDPGDIETYEYNILGYEASSACVRLNTRDAFWIFVNCPFGTEVNIVYDWDNYRPLDPEPIYQIPTDIEELKGWDPTDTVYYHSDGNPWSTYSAGLTNDTVYVPSYSSVSTLVSYLAPVDVYGNDVSNYFHTDGGYNLDEPGTYTTTGYIEIGNLSFEFPITIYVTEEISEDYYDYDYDYTYEDYGYEDTDYDYGYDTGYDESGYEDNWYEETGYDEYEYGYDESEW